MAKVVTVPTKIHEFMWGVINETLWDGTGNKPDDCCECSVCLEDLSDKEWDILNEGTTKEVYILRKKHGCVNPNHLGIADQVCYARDMYAAKNLCWDVNSEAFQLIREMDEDHDWDNNFDEFKEGEERQGARYLYGHFVYLVAEDEDI